MPQRNFDWFSFIAMCVGSHQEVDAAWGGLCSSRLFLPHTTLDKRRRVALLDEEFNLSWHSAPFLQPAAVIILTGGASWSLIDLSQAIGSCHCCHCCLDDVLCVMAIPNELVTSLIASDIS